MSQVIESKNTHDPKNEKGEHFAIASIIVKSIKEAHSYKPAKRSIRDKSVSVDELHIKADMVLTCSWHDPAGKWKESEITFSKSYNHSRGERAPNEHDPLVFKRTKTGGFEL